VCVCVNTGGRTNPRFTKAYVCLRVDPPSDSHSLQLITLPTNSFGLLQSMLRVYACVSTLIVLSTLCQGADTAIQPLAKQLASANGCRYSLDTASPHSAKAPIQPAYHRMALGPRLVYKTDDRQRRRMRCYRLHIGHDLCSIPASILTKYRGMKSHGLCSIPAGILTKYRGFGGAE
jgi:hypothetical protein